MDSTWTARQLEQLAAYLNKARKARALILAREALVKTLRSDPCYMQY